MSEEDFPFTCPECGSLVKSADNEKLFGVSTWVCPNGHWAGVYPCGPYGHEEHDTPGLEGKCKFCQRPIPDEDEEEGI
jgi:predicted RNA-binding Zn-ribbon protein involved in translation (DUF1610 family)